MNQLFGQPSDMGHTSDRDLGSAAVPVRPLPVAGAEQAFFHLDIKRSLQLHGRLARNVAIAGAVLAIAYFLFQTLVLRSWPAFVAESMVYVQPNQSKVYEPGQGGSPRWPFDNNTYESYLQQQMMNVTRDDVLANALKKLGDFQQHGESEQAAALRLVRALTVTREGNGYTFSIGARAGTGEFAADIANAVTAAYLESIRRDQKSGDSQRLSMLSDEKDRIAKALDADHTEQETLNRQLGVASVGSVVPDHFDEDITSTRAELIKARTEHDAAEAKFAALDAGRGPSSTAIDAAADEIVASDAGLVSMKTSLNQRRATLISQMANLTPSHPQYKQDEVELGKINTELESMMRDLRAKAAARIQLQLQSDLQRTAGVESQVNGQLRRLVGAAGGATPKMQRSGDLASDITRLQARYATVDEQLHNLMLEDNAPAAAYQVTPAVAPLSRTKSGVLRNVLLIMIAGMIFGVLAAVAARKLDPKIYIAKDAELILGFAPMAQLPDFNEVSAGVAEEYLLRLASSIEHARKQSNLRSLVFTGTGAGNGVTMLVNRIGGMLEAMGRPTVLVDASGATAPDAPPRSNPADNTPGLVPVERISRPTALLQQMIEETETQDESLILTDTAPLPLSAETEYLARFVDCAIVVIESGKTTRRELREAAATLQRLDVAAVGFVLNRVGLKKADPAFRDSVQAIEKHLEAQAVSQAAQRAEAIRSLPSDTLWPTPAPAVTEFVAQENSPRAHFEAEAAAASAAVARLSHPADPTPEAEASLPSPTIAVPVPVAESAVAFANPLIADHAPASEPLEELGQAHPAAAEQVLEHSETIMPAPPAAQVAPFVEAAHQVSATFGAHPVSHSSVAERSLFAALGGLFVASKAVKHEEAALSAPLVEPESEPYKPLFTQAADDAPVAPVYEPESREVSEPQSETAHETQPEPIAEPAQPSFAHAAEETEVAAAHKPAFVLADFVKDEPQQIPQAFSFAPEAEPEAGAETIPPLEALSEPESDPVAAVPAAIPESEPQPIAAVVEAVPEVITEPAAEAYTAPAPDPTPIPASAPAPAPDVPWWLGEAGGQRATKRPPVIWKPAKVRVSVPSLDHAALSPLRPNVTPEPHQTGAPLTHSWSPVSSEQHLSSDSASREAAPATLAQTPDQQEPSEHLSSRLSGLRSLLFVLGVKEGQDPIAHLEHQGAGQSSGDETGERPAIAAVELEDRHDISPTHIGGASPRLVTAPPEFLAPQPTPVSAGREAAASQSHLHLDRRTAYDGVEILPSRKGQYKKV